MPEGDGSNQDLAGYKSVDELVRAYRESSNEGKKQRERADRYEQSFEQRLGQIEQLFTRQQAPQRTTPEDRLSDYGIPVDALDQFLGDRLEKAIARQFEPIVKMGSARNSMLSSYTDYGKFEADVAKFVESDPSVQRTYSEMFKADPLGAMEWAFLKYGQAERGKVTGNGQPTPQQQARTEAQIPSNRAGDTRTLPQLNGDQQTAQGWEHYQKTGDPRAFAKARLRQAISDDFLNR